MNETVNQENATNNAPDAAGAADGKTFTQAELDAIVSDRLKRDRAKYADYEDLKAKAAKLDEIEEAAKSDLQKATERANELQKELDGMKAADARRVMRDAVAKETGVPADLLTGATEDECREQAKNLLAFKGSDTYPSVKDSGEVNNVGKLTTRQQFADWAEKAFS